MRAVTLCVCASLVVSVVTAQVGILEEFQARTDERINKTEENVASLMSKLQSIIEKQASELNKTAALEDLTRKQKSTIDELSKENDDQAKRLGQLEAEIKKDEETVNALGNKVSALEKQIEGMESLQNDVKILNDKLAKAESQDKLVFFTAGVDDKGRSNYGNGERVVFNKVFTNIGNAYKNGLFIVPFDGIYEFTVNLLGVWDAKVNAMAHLKKNGVSMIYICSEDSESSMQAATNSVILRLSKNDHLEVITYSKFKIDIGHVASTFSGKILAPL